ncbi:hypothetical protein ACP70R_008290 [Stipagrostis hirtigluma subsp. patula]
MLVASAASDLTVVTTGAGTSTSSSLSSSSSSLLSSSSNGQNLDPEPSRLAPHNGSDRDPLADHGESGNPDGTAAITGIAVPPAAGASVRRRLGAAGAPHEPLISLSPFIACTPARLSVQRVQPIIPSNYWRRG